jgi:hypothetical protein
MTSKIHITTAKDVISMDKLSTIRRRLNRDARGASKYLLSGSNFSFFNIFTV